jgi:hypothetical protein
MEFLDTPFGIAVAVDGTVFAIYADGHGAWAWVMTLSAAVGFEAGMTPAWEA